MGAGRQRKGVTCLPLESDVQILHGDTRMIAVQSRFPVRPYRLWVAPVIAGGIRQ